MLATSVVSGRPQPLRPPDRARDDEQADADQRDEERREPTGR